MESRGRVKAGGSMSVIPALRSEGHVAILMNAIERAIVHMKRRSTRKAQEALEEGARQYREVEVFHKQPR